MNPKFKISTSQTEDLKENISDIKGYVFRILTNWKWFLVTIPIALVVAYYINLSTERIYGLSATIAVKDKQNSLFSSGTNIAFNWGGTSDKVEGVRRVLSSRSHNEKVVNELEFYVNYLQEGQFRIEDAYGRVPFKVEMLPGQFQLLNTLIYIDFIDNDSFQMSIDFEERPTARILNYDANLSFVYDVVSDQFSQKFKLGDKISLPFLNFSLKPIEGFGNRTGKSFMIRFDDRSRVVSKYKRVRAVSIPGTSLLDVVLTGPNKSRLVDYLNKSVEILAEDQLKEKTNYARQTLKFIEDQFKNTEDSLSTIEGSIGHFKQKEEIYDLSAEGSLIFSKTTELDDIQTDLVDRLEYYTNLENYIKTSQDFTNIPAPAVIDVEDSAISSSVAALTGLITEREKLSGKITASHPSLIALNHDIATTKNILLENISSLKKVLQLSVSNVQKRINIYDAELKTLPKKEQKLLKYQRRYAMTEANYMHLMQKQYEAGIAIAASMSDITVLDKAKDTGQISTKPRKPFNYMVGVLLGILLPLFLIIAIEILDTKIQTVEQIESQTSIPVLGVVGRSTAKNGLAVFLNPKAPVAESFRALRSSIHFLFDRKKRDKSKTIMITSSVSGEGKTFISINMATVFALSGKKTVLVGLDLRKPKIFGDFDISNDIGVVNYLSGQKTIEEVIFHSQIENLDVITAGPIPPNPSELIMSSAAEELMEYLKEHYDYIILDTPPVGLVADAFELVKYADATIYVVKQGVTQKGMLKMINDKHAKKEVSKISIVLNNFKVKSEGYGYGYGGGYGYGYGYGYYEEEEKLPIYKRIFKRK